MRHVIVYRSAKVADMYLFVDQHEGPLTPELAGAIDMIMKDLTP